MSMHKSGFLKIFEKTTYQDLVPLNSIKVPFLSIWCQWVDCCLSFPWIKPHKCHYHEPSLVNIYFVTSDIILLINLHKDKVFNSTRGSMISGDATWNNHFKPIFWKGSRGKQSVSISFTTLFRNNRGIVPWSKLFHLYFEYVKMTSINLVSKICIR